MTILNIKPTWLRRIVVIISLLLWPIIVVVYAIVETFPEYIRQVKSQWNQGGGFWKAVKNCWRDKPER